MRTVISFLLAVTGKQQLRLKERRNKNLRMEKILLFPTYKSQNNAKGKQNFKERIISFQKLLKAQPNLLKTPNASMWTPS